MFSAKGILGVTDGIETVSSIVSEFVEAAKKSFQDDLISVILFGSAAEDKLRASSDVNILLVLKNFSMVNVDSFCAPLRMAHVTCRVETMFLLESEIADATEAFAVKFDDIERRRKVLFGSDIFANIKIPRQAMKTRLRQVLLNLSMRLRERYAMSSQNEERLVELLAEMAGPLRASAASLLDLEGQKSSSPSEALRRLSASFDKEEFTAALDCMSQARGSETLSPGDAGKSIFSLMSLTKLMLERLGKLE